MPPGGTAGARTAARASGGFIKKMVGNLLRPARKIAQKRADKAAVKLGRDRARQLALRDAAGTSDDMAGRLAREKAGFKAAGDARDRMHDDLVRQAKAGNASNRVAKRRLGNKQVVTGAHDPATGLSAAGHNFPAGGKWGCAEKNALDNLNALRAQHGHTTPLKETDVMFSEARKIKLDGSYEPKPICKAWCQEKTYPWQYAPGTRPQAGGAWGRRWPQQYS